MFDVYEGKGIDPDKKSIAIAVTIQPREKTMTDQEIDAVAAKVVAEVQMKTGGTLQGDAGGVLAPFPVILEDPRSGVSKDESAPGWWPSTLRDARKCALLQR